MRNLLAAEFHRIRRDPVSWILAVAALLSGVFFGLLLADGRMDDVFILPLFVLLGVFISLSLGREFNDGTFRNKLIAGKTKTAVFLSKLLTGMVVSLVFTAAFLLPCATLARSVLSRIPAEALVWMVLGFFLLDLVWAVLFTLVSTLISAKGVAGLVNLALVFALFFAAYELEHVVRQPAELPIETIVEVPMSPEEVAQAKAGSFTGMTSEKIDENGVVTYYKSVVIEEGSMPNPNYVQEPFNGLLRGLHSSLPSAQTHAYAHCLNMGFHQSWETQELPRLKSYPLYSLSVILLLSAMGLAAFRKKEIR